MARKIRSEDPITYNADPVGVDVEARLRLRIEDEKIAEALQILRGRVKRRMVCSPQDLRNLLVVELSGERTERFGAVLLNSQHAVIDIVTIATGTIDSATVPPRELVRAALLADAAAVVIFHNHPSGNPEPSGADRALTNTLCDALRLVGIRLLDHIIAAGGEYASFAERGYI
jgi:DNA repair protein RadC